jgi:hypothetical protein
MKTKLMTAAFMLSMFICLAPVQAQQVINNESFNTTPFPTGGWTNSGATSLWVQRTNGTNPTCTPHSGAAMARFSSNQQPSGTQDVFFSPVIDYSNTQGATPYFSIWVYREGSSTAGDSITIFVNTIASTTGAVRIGGVARSRFFALPNPEPANAWYQYTFNVPASFNTSTNYIILRGTARGGGNIYVDDFSWDSYPTPCSGTPTAGAITAASTNICGGTGNTVLNLTGASSELGITYQWQSGPSDIGPWTDFGLNEVTTNSGNLNVTTWFRCIVTCTASGLNDITAPLEVVVIQTPPPVVAISPGTGVFYCSNSAPVLLIASGASTYTWLPNIAASANGDSALAAPTQNTTYTIIGTDASGCVDTTTLQVQFRTSPNVNATTSNDTICDGSSANLQAFAFGGFGIQYVWSPGGLTGANQTVSPSSTTTYYVTGTSQQSTCSDTDSVTISVEPQIIAGFTTVVNGTVAVFTNTSLGGTIFNWDFGDGSFSSSANPFHAYAFDGVYNVTLIVGNSICQNDTITQTITISTTGLSEAFDGGVGIFPIPSNDVVNMIWPENTCSDITIYNLNGKVVSRNSCTDSNKLQINVAHWPAGVYAAVVKTNHNRVQLRFVVQ